MTTLAKRILLTDSGAGLLVGALVLALHGVLAELYGVSRSLLLVTGAANVAYGAFSAQLALRAVRGHRVAPWMVEVLVYANALWGLVCAALVVSLWREAGALGLAHLTLEGLFVVGLAATERRWVRPQVRAVSSPS